MSDANPELPSPRGSTLADLAREIPGARVVGDPLTRVGDVRHDSRDVQPGDLFVARLGAQRDGAAFAGDAVARGAAAVMAQSELSLPVAQLVVPDAEYGLAWASSEVWGHPTWTLDVVGITGTNGKTTTAWLVEHALAKLGASVGLLGTVAHRFGALSWPALHTTPEADDLARRFAAMRAAGATHAVMEVSSHAIALKRVAAVRFRVAALTNVTQDHLDFHGTMERYVAAKRSLFEAHGPGASVVNADDPVGASLARVVPGAVAYSAKGAEIAQLRVVSGGAGVGGVDARVATPEGEVRLRSPLVGAHNVENLLAALGIVAALEHPYARVAEALADAAGAPGRLERVAPSRGGASFEVLVDYAHTPDALARVLAAVRGATPGRVVCVFGCGGDRDRHKRPRMGAAVADGADVAIVTTDNPRSEDPAAIAEATAEGLRAHGFHEVKGRPKHGEFAIVLDRREAIALAVSLAVAGDTVLIAGKGHETYQEVRGVRSPFDDREEARAALDARLHHGG